MVNDAGLAHPPDRPLFDAFPALRGRLPWVALGEWPTPIEALPGFESAFIKRDDLSSPVYGGNKVRTLEVLFGAAIASGATEIWSTGAFGTNHGTASQLHAPRVGLRPGAVLFPQPPSACALENFRVLLGAQHALIPHWAALPATMMRVRAQAEREGRRIEVMVPGGATPRGALGYVSAAFELAQQIAAGDAPAPRTIVLGVGSTCTSAGLLLGTALAARRRLGFTAAPKIVAVRVTPWPVTDPRRIAWLAHRASRHLAHLLGDSSVEVPYGALRERLVVDGRELGFGYGRATRRGRQAMRALAEVPSLNLDTTYSGKAAAGLLRTVERSEHLGPTLFWTTKSSAPLPAPEIDHAALSPSVRRWIRRAGRAG